MNVIKRNLKRGIALLVAFTLVFGLVPVWTGKIDVVQAATGTTPSVTAFATKQQLMTEFVPNGTNGKVAKIKFGGYSSRGTFNAFEWYVLGPDSGVSGENTIIFATNYTYYNSYFFLDGMDRSLEDCEYDGTKPDTVWTSHYGISKVRDFLQEMVVSSTTYFSASEKAVMNNTTIQTEDKNNSRFYSTTDALYLPSGNYGESIIKVGSKDHEVVLESLYWSSGLNFGCAHRMMKIVLIL